MRTRRLAALAAGLVIVGALVATSPAAADVTTETAPELDAFDVIVSERGVQPENVLILSNGNYAIGDPGAPHAAGVPVGTVSLYDGVTHELISRMEGGGDSDAFGSTMVEVGDSNLLVLSTGVNMFAVRNVGAVTWIDGRIGRSGVVGPGNSLHGLRPDDRVGENDKEMTSENDDVRSPGW